MPIEFPKNRKEVSDRMKTDVQNELPDSRPFLRVSFLGAFISSMAGRVFEYYTQLKLLIVNAFPDTATGEFLSRWGTYRNITRVPASQADGFVNFQGTLTSNIAIGVTIQADGNQYLTLNSATIVNNNFVIDTLEFSSGIITATTELDHTLSSSLTATISGGSEAAYNGTFEIIVSGSKEFTYLPISTPSNNDGGTTAEVDSEYAESEVESIGFGQDQNLGNGAKMTITTPIAGVNNDGFVQFGEIAGGADAEDDQNLRERILNSYQNPNTPFNVAEIERLSKTVSGVTRVFVFEPDLTQGSMAVDSLDRIDDKTIKVSFSAPHGMVGATYISIVGANELEYNTTPTPIVVPNPDEMVYTVPVNPATTPATGPIRAEFADLQPGQTRVLFMRDEDADPIPTAPEVTDVKNILLTIKPAHMSDIDLIVEAPIPVTIDFSFDFIVPNTLTMQSAITANLEEYFKTAPRVGETILATTYNSVIANTIDLETGDRLRSFGLIAPTDSLQFDLNEIGLLGDVTFT